MLHVWGRTLVVSQHWTLVQGWSRLGEGLLELKVHLLEAMWLRAQSVRKEMETA